MHNPDYFPITREFSRGAIEITPEQAVAWDTVRSGPIKYRLDDITALIDDVKSIVNSVRHLQTSSRLCTNLVDALAEASGYCRSVIHAYLPHMNHQLNNFLFNITSKDIAFQYKQRGRRRGVPVPDDSAINDDYEVIDENALETATRQFGLPTGKLMADFADYLAVMSRVLSLYETLDNDLRSLYTTCQSAMQKQRLAEMNALVGQRGRSLARRECGCGGG
jgi:hypothetical protein